MKRAVLRPDVPFSQLRERLTAAGWSEVEVPGTLAPLRSGEPETAMFENGPEGTLLTYSFNPALSLREIAGEALPGDDVALSVTSKEVATWLESECPATSLRGLFAARSLGLNDLAARAQMAAASLPDDVRNIGLRQANRLTLSSRASELGAETFTALPASIQRETLRNLLIDRAAAAQSLLLPSLQSDDTELAAIAAIAALRGQRNELAGAVAAVQFSRLETDRRTAARLKAIGKLVPALLAGTAGSPKNAAEQAFRSALYGEQGDDAVAALVAALLTPAPEIKAIERVGDDSHVFHCIAAISHQVGHEQATQQQGRWQATALQQWKPSVAFGISVTTVSNHLSLKETEERLAELSQAFGVSLRLPDCKEWEAAMRGPGGSPYPWGLDSRRPESFLTGPWGLAAPAPEGEWATEDGNAFVMGCASSGHLAERQRAEDGVVAALRPVFDLKV